ncbi:hypothetical protein [Nostoc sp.]
MTLLWIGCCRGWGFCQTVSYLSSLQAKLLAAVEKIRRSDAKAQGSD